MTKLEDFIGELKKANQRLKEVGGVRPTMINKDATFLRFRITFELAWKTIQEYIRDQGFDCKSPKNCLREAGRLGLIDDVEKWFEFLRKRNLIAHVYNEKLADEIYRQAVKFPQEIDKLLRQLS